jgi:bifunctional oligoribonuclease and PAP phosphatase NrnA
MTWSDLSNFIERHQSFLIASHLSLDGDCVGSQLAFYWYLTSLGKTVYIYNQDPVPAKFAFLANAGRISTEFPATGFEALAVLDCSNLRRAGGKVEQLGAFPAINVDHHRDNTRFGVVNFVDPKAAATGEILYRFFSESGIDFPPEVAEALYTAILTDTGGFRFPNTTNRVLRICADLADRGADPAKVYERVYASHSRTGLLLQSRIWSTLKFHLDGKVCSMEMPMALLAELGAPYSDSEGMADHTITAADVEVGILTKYTETETHFSLRSRGRVDVGKIAQQIKDGGGHSSAAGCTVYSPFPQAFERMLRIIEQALS